MGQQLVPRDVAERRLESTSWCTRHSLWMLLPLLSLGLLTWAGLLLVATRANRPQLRTRAAGFGLAAAAVAALMAMSTLRLGPIVPLMIFCLFSLWMASIYQAFVLNKEYLNAMAFRLPWQTEPAPEVAPVPAIDFDTSTPDEVKIAQLKQGLIEVVRRARTAGDKLPVEAIPRLRALQRTLGELLEHLGNTGALPEEMAAVSAPIEDYLPKTIDAFLSLPNEIITGRRTLPGTTRTAGDELIKQLELIAAGVEEAKDSVYAHDLQALATQGRFLDTKFSRSDLDL